MSNYNFEKMALEQFAMLQGKLDALLSLQQAGGTGATAEENLARVSEDRNKGSFVTDDPQLSDAICLFLEQKADYVTPQHHANLSRQLGALVPEPKYWTPGQVTRGDVAQRIDKLHADGRSAKTINNHLAAISSFLVWCRARGWVDEDVSQGLKKRVTTRASRRRKAFDDDEIQWVFNGLSSALTGAPHAEKYWLPLIMLYTGARPEEIAQLRVCDLLIDTLQHPIKCFDFRGLGDDQRIKNDASRRIVPIHPHLIKRGLLHLVEHRLKDSTNLLFDQLRHGASGRLAEAPSRWFNEVWLRDRKGITDPKHVLYSIRHSVATKLKWATVPEAMISEILGHANNSMSTGRYGKEYPLSEMQRALEALTWEV